MHCSLDFGCCRQARTAFCGIPCLLKYSMPAEQQQASPATTDEGALKIAKRLPAELQKQDQCPETLVPETSTVQEADIKRQKPAPGPQACEAFPAADAAAGTGMPKAYVEAQAEAGPQTQKPDPSGAQASAVPHAEAVQQPDPLVPRASAVPQAEAVKKPDPLPQASAVPQAEAVKKPDPSAVPQAEAVKKPYPLVPQASAVPEAAAVKKPDPLPQASAVPQAEAVKKPDPLVPKASAVPQAEAVKKPYPLVPQASAVPEAAAVKKPDPLVPQASAVPEAQSKSQTP